MSMPDEFELPLPRDFCRRDFTKITNHGIQHCFMGWQRELLPMPIHWVLSNPSEREELNRFHDIALKVAKKMKLKTKYGACVFNYNDDTRNTPARLAEWFEKTVKEFGYDIS